MRWKIGKKKALFETFKWQSGLSVFALLCVSFVRMEIYFPDFWNWSFGGRAMLLACYLCVFCANYAVQDTRYGRYE